MWSTSRRSYRSEVYFFSREEKQIALRKLLGARREPKTKSIRPESKQKTEAVKSGGRNTTAVRTRIGANNSLKNPLVFRVVFKSKTTSYQVVFWKINCIFPWVYVKACTQLPELG